jgi:hypothetical protein
MPQFEDLRKTGSEKTGVLPKADETHTQKGMVYIEKGVTKSMGDYQFAKVTIGLSLPINYSEDDLAEAKRTIKVLDKIVTKELEKQVDSLFDEE